MRFEAKLWMWWYARPGTKIHYLILAGSYSTICQSFQTMMINMNSRITFKLDQSSPPPYILQSALSQVAKKSGKWSSRRGRVVRRRRMLKTCQQLGQKTQPLHKFQTPLQLRQRSRIRSIGLVLFPMEGWCGEPVAPLELAPQWLETQSPSPCFVGHNVTLLQVQYLWLGCLQPTGTLQFSPTHWSRGESNTYPVNTTEQAK